MLVRWPTLAKKLYRLFCKPVFTVNLNVNIYTMDNILLYTKLSNLPDNMKAEVDNFIDVLLKKKNKKTSKNKAKFGSAKGIFKMEKNFDDPVDDFKDYQ